MDAKLLAAGLSIGLGAIGPGIGVGLVFSKMLESMARQPELTGQLRGMALIGAAMAEAIALYALVVSLVILMG